MMHALDPFSSFEMISLLLEGIWWCNFDIDDDASGNEIVRLQEFTGVRYYHHHFYIINGLLS